MRENFYPFALERDMGIWEHAVAYNLSESGVHPLTARELFNDDPDLITKFLDTELNYIQSNGSLHLRDQIAQIYGATRDDICVTVGAAQGNFTAILATLDPGDEVVIMLPNYMQIYGTAVNLGLDVKTFSLKHELGWGFDLDEFRSAVSPKTKLIAVCNPNNPTGHIMTAAERQTVIAAAAEVGAWILSDEVYAGAEHHTAEVTPSFWGEYDKVLAVGSMSKAYALPGLRVGWVVSNPEMAAEIWARQDYVTICSTMLGDQLAAYALSPEVRPRILKRTRDYTRQGFATLQNWCQEHSDIFSVIPPEAAAIGFVKYNLDINSGEFVNFLATEYDTYIVPGDHFGMDHYLRISYGLAEDYVVEGLSRIATGIRAFSSK
jgi:aspartate/methionine/tyrosine aminotransferase